MTQSPAVGLSTANHQSVDANKSKALPQLRKTLPADAVGEYDLFGYFAYADSPAQPGENVLTVSLFANVWIVLASVTEVNADGTPHIGDAVFDVQSVELDNPGQIAQITFNLDWGNPLNYGAMLIIGYIP
jgi:hypothetical protein